VDPIDTRGTRPNRRDRSRTRRRPEVMVLESLENRDLMAYSALGFSLPNLTVHGYAAPVAAYQGLLAVTVDVSNIGAGSMIEPLAIQQGSPSSADAGPTSVTVYISPTRHFSPRSVPIGTIPISGVPQNSIVEETAVLNLPNRLRGFQPVGGHFYVNFRVNENRAVTESNYRDNVQRIGSPVQTASYLPDLYAIALNTPPVMQPGDVIAPVIKIANFGTADPSIQGPFKVNLVASTDQNFGPGDTVLAQFTVSSLYPLSFVPSQNTVLGDLNVADPINVLALQSPAVTLPTGDTSYYLGVIVDPDDAIREIHEVGVGPDSSLNPIRQVGAPIPGLPPATEITTPATNVFPYPPFGAISTGANTDPTNPLASISITTSSQILNPYYAALQLGNGITTTSTASAQSTRALRFAALAKARQS
jgi:hypothetical protein